MKSTICATLVLLLTACGGGENYTCPVVTPENVHLMTGNLPPGHPCTQDYAPREQVTVCALPLDQAGPPAPCQWGPT
jgi:hypothetical protein